MTAKEFFKSNVFKCLATLLCVLLVSGVFLTIMNGLLAVSDEERFQRAINKIYGKSVRTSSVAVANYNDNATINEAYKVLDDGNYLIKSTGKGGFDNGTVTCWVVVVVSNGSIKGVDKVVIDSNKGQSYISNINNAFLSGFKTNYVEGEPFSPDKGFVKTGATRSATAICNAVNGAVDFVNAIFGNVAKDIFEGFDLKEYIESRLSSYTVDKDKNVKYILVTRGYDNAGAFTISTTVDVNGIITAYKIDKNGSTGGFESSMLKKIEEFFVGKDFAAISKLANEGFEYGSVDGSMHTGATQSNFLCLYAAAFATKNFEKCIKAAADAEGGESNE